MVHELYPGFKFNGPRFPMDCRVCGKARVTANGMVSQTVRYIVESNRSYIECIECEEHKRARQEQLAAAAVPGAFIAKAAAAVPGAFIAKDFIGPVGFARPHRTPPSVPVLTSQKLYACGEIEKGKDVVACTCGALRQHDREHAYRGPIGTGHEMVLADACGTLEAENGSLLKENARLRRKVERLELEAKRKR